MSNKIVRGAAGPAIVYKKGGAAVIEFTGIRNAGKKNDPAAAPEDHENPDVTLEELSRDGKPWQPWGISDQFPIELAKLIRKSTVGRSGLQRLTKSIYGQRLMTYKVIGYADNGEEIIERLHIPEWEAIQRRSNFNVVRLALNQDYSYFGLCYPELRLNGNKTKVWGVDFQKCVNTRLEKMDKKGNINNVYLSGQFPNVSAEDARKMPAIDFIRFADQIEAIKKNYKDFTYVMPQYWPDVLNAYYPEVFWYSAKEHLEIATSIPAYIKALFKNQMSLKFHIQIPYSYLEEMYPGFKTMGEDEQDTIVGDLYDDIIKNLTGAENAEKAILSFYGVGKDGKPSGQWIIDPIDDKMRNEHNLPNASAANTEIMTAMDLNPALNGQGNTGGDYTGGSNNGGSNIRESALDLRSRMQADRDITLSFFKFIQEYNGWDPEAQLGVQDMVLTTLDTGSGSKKVVS